MRVSWLIVAALLPPALAAVPTPISAQAPPATCGSAALPGLEAARARLRPETPGAGTVVLTALRAASVDEFLQIAAAITGLAPTAPAIDELVRSPIATLPLPCSAAVVARDRVTYALLLGGYSAREIADIVSGRLSKRDIDDAQRLLMAGQREAVVAAFLDRALQARARRAERAHPQSARRSPPPRRAAPRAPAPRTPSVVPPAAIVTDAGIQAAILRLARQYGVDPGLVQAMVAAESGGAADAVSHKGAIGLMQLMPATARMLGVDPSDPIDNLRGGIAYLAGLLAQFGNTRDALIAYNAGPSHAERVRGGLAVLYGETRKYLDTIGRRYPL